MNTQAKTTSPILHIGGWGIGTPLVFMLGAGGLFALLHAPTSQTLLVTVLAGFAGILIGPVIGIVSFLVFRGARGWGAYFANRRAQGVQHPAPSNEAELIANVENEIAEHLGSSGALESQSADPWNGTNPYGCCQNNRDADGVLSHGSPDCMHPLIVAQRQQ